MNENPNSRNQIEKNNNLFNELTGNISEQIVSKTEDATLNFIRTYAEYSNIESEKIIGEFVKNIFSEGYSRGDENSEFANEIIEKIGNQAFINEAKKYLINSVLIDKNEFRNTFDRILVRVFQQSGELEMMSLISFIKNYFGNLFDNLDEQQKIENLGILEIIRDNIQNMLNKELKITYGALIITDSNENIDLGKDFELPKSC